MSDVEHRVAEVPDEFIVSRVEYLKAGGRQFGHEGKHHGSGKPGCPKALHHHHDDRCDPPTPFEFLAAGVEPFEPDPRG